MSVHIGAQKGEIAETVLMPGDPLRAKFIAENFLEDAVCYNEVRGMYGYTGTYKGKRISVQGSGMGLPSISIYGHELINEYGVKKLIRVGSCGSFQPHVKVRDIVIAQAASTNASVNRNRFKGMDFAPVGDFDMLMGAVAKAMDMGINPHVGNILSSDIFYDDDPNAWKLWAEYGVLAVEMETTALYTLAAKFGVKALTVLTVSDSLVTHEALPAEDREKTFTQMMEIALDIA
ncbi:MULTISPECIES: purine-nucleoside phosphorylase [Persicobacter]|uniref:Uridine phosphorylase n=1 Tax=Persicobacter diffluens TaxID=981 RepID=A0AAN5AJ67_9BACT|nr:purine-nucleoside phosphorylase [Persicobacter sp. CCB-QB2]GJM61285.1 purine-nucleoside phosphorylase [Persicobacter diffluens]